MDGEIFRIALYAIGGCSLGVLTGWWFQSLRSQRQTSQATRAAQEKLNAVLAHRNELASKFSGSQAQLDQLEAASAEQRAKLLSVLKKSKLLARNVQVLREERENTKKKLGALQDTLASLRQQTGTLQNEFDKTRKFYKRELLRSLQRRKELEEEILKARAKQESFAKAVETSVLEHGSTENMVIAAQLRLGQ